MRINHRILQHSIAYVSVDTGARVEAQRRNDLKRVKSWRLVKCITFFPFFGGEKKFKNFRTAHSQYKTFFFVLYLIAKQIKSNSNTNGLPR